jgi:hypothetical protein
MLSTHKRPTENSECYAAILVGMVVAVKTDSLAAGRTEYASEAVTLTVCSCQFRQVVKRFPTFYETRKFVTVFKTTHHFFLSIAR